MAGLTASLSTIENLESFAVCDRYMGDIFRVDLDPAHLVFVAGRVDGQMVARKPILTWLWRRGI